MFILFSISFSILFSTVISAAISIAASSIIFVIILSASAVSFVVFGALSSEDLTVKVKRLRFYFFKSDLGIVLIFGAVLGRPIFFEIL